MKADTRELEYVQVLNEGLGKTNDYLTTEVVMLKIELAEAGKACLELAAKHGYATGHGDTVADMIREFSAQIPNTGSTKVPPPT